jgi:prepilin-type N-terminal cleavage/methylation domain-containing protein
MFTNKPKKQSHGFSLIEVIVASALIALIFGGLFSTVQIMVKLIGTSKAEAAARSLAVSKMEYIRSLDYDAVGTIAGIPSGPIPQISTTSLNGILFTERVLVQYLDRDEDGFGVADTNGITEDSKRIKIEYTWTIREVTDSLVMVSDIVPPGIESTSGGGTLMINVFDASVQPVVGAQVHVFNNNVATDTIDVIVTTNANGIANFPGAPARAGYQITVTKAGYSTDQTYSASTTNPNPNPSHVSVGVGAVSTVYFSIDQLSDLTIRTISTPVRNVFSDSFSDALGIASSTNINVSGGNLVLSDIAGVYATAGRAYATAIDPVTISSWESFDFNGTSTINSTFKVQLYSVSTVGSSTVYTLVPDSDLPGNTAGFIDGPIVLTSLNPSTYPILALGASITTTNTAQTASLYDWSLTYIESEAPVGNIDISIAGLKTIGENAGSPVLKYTNNVTTNGSGLVTLSDLEWDAYNIIINGAVEGYDIAEAYAPLPYALLPGVNDTLTIVLEPHSAYSLRTTVVDNAGEAIPGADVRLFRSGYDQTLTTSIYGQVYFDALASSSAYTVAVEADGYDPDTQTNVSITGTTAMLVELALAGTGSPVPTSTPTTTVSNYLAGYNQRLPLTISSSNIYGNVTNFPVYVNLANLPSGFFSAVQSNGADIRVTDSSGLTELPFELVSINTVARTGQLYFKAPSLSISTDAEFYIYFGHATATAYAANATYGRNNVWTENFIAVYHLEETQAGTATNDLYVDSTGGGNDGDDFITATGKLGKIGSGQEFNDATSDRIRLPNTTLDGRTNVTLSFWYRTNTNDSMTILSGARSGQFNEYLFWFKDRNELEFFSHGDPRVNFSIININDDVWRHYVSIRDDTNNQTRLYLNGTEDNQSPATDSMTTLSIASGGLFIGADQDSVGGSFDEWLDGELDELRLASVVRSAGWVANEYVNQDSPSSFYSVGAIEIE